MGVALMAWTVLTAAGWGYEPAARFGEIGPCHSAAQRGQRFAVGCRSGVWVGAADGLELVIRCLAEGESSNRVRALDERAFVAGTPCGLFVIEDGRPVSEIPLPGPPGALAADGRGRLVVVVGGEVVEVFVRRGGRRRVGRWPGESEPGSLSLAGGGVVIPGRRCRLVEPRPVVLLPPAAGARSAVSGPGRIVWVGPGGEVWEQGFGGLARRAGELPMSSVERVRRVKDLADGRVWVDTGRRWFVLGRGQRMEGWLPSGSGSPLPVRSGPADRPPWLVMDGLLVRPVPRSSAQRSWCVAVRQRPASTARSIVPGSGTSPWRALLPRVDVKAWGRRTWTTGFYNLGGWSYRADSRYGFAVLLTWPLDQPELVEDLILEERVRREAGEQWRRRTTRIEQLLSERDRLCHGRPGSLARLELESIDSQLAALGWDVKTFAQGSEM